MNKVVRVVSAEARLRQELRIAVSILERHLSEPMSLEWLGLVEAISDDLRKAVKTYQEL
jgi:hypothetical protein